MRLPVGDQREPVVDPANQAGGLDVFFSAAIENSSTT